MKSGRAPCSDEVFVVAWEKANSLAEVAKMCGYRNKYTASNRATRLRHRGVRLRPFQSGGLPGHPGPSRRLNWLAKRARKDAK